MKKGVIALILLLVMIIIVSPGIVGKLAEKSVDENLNHAAMESGGEIIVTSESFDRGWFSSEGQHRVELGDGQLRGTVLSIAGDGDLPVLLINTRIDHGLIPVGSMGREQGSLEPGLGSAISTLALEVDGETIDVPGTIYSKVGLGGDLDSLYELEAGSTETDDGEVTWEDTTIRIATNATSGELDFDGKIGAMSFGDDQQRVTIDGLTMKGSQDATRFGFNVGDVEMTMGAMTVNSSDMQVAGNQGLQLTASSSLDDDSLDGDLKMVVNSQSIPGFGELSIAADMRFDGLDAAALQAINESMKDAATADPSQALMSGEEHLKDLFAAGFNVDLEQLDMSLPLGTVESSLSVSIPETDRNDFVWTSLLIRSEAKLDLKIPEAVVQMATSMDPSVGAIVGLGYLKKEGDYYIMDAEFKKGLLNVNGAPIPIPLGMF